jgi:hypothetical protein
VLVLGERQAAAAAVGEVTAGIVATVLGSIIELGSIALVLGEWQQQQQWHKAEGGLPGPGSVALVLGEWQEQQWWSE